VGIRFTVKGDALYAIILGKWPGSEVVIKSLATGTAAGKVAMVTMLGCPGDMKFAQRATGLNVQLPATQPCQYGYVLKITGLKMNPPTWTDSGNPQ
jgi:alpha-L-fucosidase